VSSIYAHIHRIPVARNFPTYLFRIGSTAVPLPRTPIRFTLEQENIAMAALNREDLDQLERRELHLTILAVAFVLIQAAGLAAFMYPPAFDHPKTRENGLFALPTLAFAC